MSKELKKDLIHSGSLKSFEKRKSRHSWTERWAVLDSNSLRLFTNYESFLNASDEPKLIKLTADTFCESVDKNGQTFQFKICHGDTFVFRCESESSRQEWLSKLGMVISNFCRNSCFHCSGECDPRISIISDGGYSDRSSQSSQDGTYSQPGDIIQSTFNSRSTNISRHSTGYEDQVTLKSPLKIYDTDQSVYSSFNKTEKAGTEYQTVGATVNVDGIQAPKSPFKIGQAMKNEKSPKNSFGYSFETDVTDNVTTSSLKLFDNQKKRFSTFSKRASLKRGQTTTQFANPGFEQEDGSSESTFPEIPKRISMVCDAPLDYDVPALSKSDPKRGSLKFLVGKNNWKKYQAAVEKNVLVLSDPESSSPEQNCVRIELKPNIKFTLLPRRNHDHRFKMTSGSSEYFFKTLNAVQRDSWINVLTKATSTVCQMACPRCCTNASRNVPNCTESDATQSDASEMAAEQCDGDADDVFYAGMAKPDEGTTFMNLCSQENANVQHGAPEEANNDLGQNESQNPPSFHSGYLKTNAIENDWKQYWLTIVGKQLVFHSSEENLDSLKAIELSANVQCKMAKRSLHDFRFTLVASAVECYEFKCVSAQNRREWMNALEKVSGRAEPDFNAGSRISAMVTKMKQNESKLEKIQLQQQQERERQQQLKEEQRQQEQRERERQQQLQEQQKQQQELLQKQQQQTTEENHDLYEVLPAETNQQQNIPSPPQRIAPPTPPQKRQQQQQNTEENQDLYEVLPAETNQQQNIPSPPQRIAPPTPPQKRQQQQHQQNTEENQDLYEIIPADKQEQGLQFTFSPNFLDNPQDIYDDFAPGNIPQHTLPPPPQQLPPLTPPQRRKQQEEQQNTLPPPPQQLPPLTPPQQKRHQQQQQQRESVDNGQDIYDDFAPTENIQQQLLPPPPPQQRPPLTPPQKRQQEQQQQQQQNTDEDDQEMYELIPGDKCQQENQQVEELYEIVPAEKIEQQQQKSKEKKPKKILPQFHLKKPKKKEKKQQQKDKPDIGTKQQEEESHQHPSKQNEERPKCKEEDKNEESPSKEITESHNKPVWNFEEHVQILPRESSSSAEDKEVEELELKAEEQNDMCVSKGNNAKAICSGSESAVPDTSHMTQDVERFLTEVLGKLGNLPENVNKERVELSKRLQKFLNLPEKDVAKKKPPPPTPTEPDEDEGEYGDVASVVPPTTKNEATGQETYDDVAGSAANAGGSEEMYDDVASGGTEGKAEPDAEELYDDIAPPPAATKQGSLSRSSNSSDTLGAKDVEEPRKVSDIMDKVYEGYLEKYKGKGLLKKWQRRYCVLTPLALYYYENQKDRKQKGQILLPSSGSTICKGCDNYPEIKDKKLCFELFNNDRIFLFKVGKESELEIWITHITAALQTDLTDEQSKLMRQKSMKVRDEDVDDDVGDDVEEELYEMIDQMQQKPPSNSSNDSKSVVEGSSGPGPALPSRSRASTEESTLAARGNEEEDEEFEIMDDDDDEDYKLPDTNLPKPVSNHQKQPPSGSPTLPPRPNSSQDAPHLPPRGATSTPASQKPPELPARSTPPTQKKTPPVLPTRTTPTLTKKSLSTTAEEPEPDHPAPEVEPKPEVVIPSPPQNPKAGEQPFDYNRVYVALWNCNADDEDDLGFSRGNYLYIREKIPNSDWWVASLMDIPEIRVGLVPRNFIMPAYDL